MDTTKKLPKRDIEDILALTPMQEGMLFHYLKDPAGDHYFEQLSVTISGGVDIRLFEEAWNTIIESNRALRTVFRWEKTGEPVQIILKRHRLNLLFLDFSDEHSGQTQIKTLLEEAKVKDRGEKFDLRDVPFRVTLCKRLPNEYEMIISNHHILFDGWSSGIILKEFFRTYDTLARGKKPEKIVKMNIKGFIENIRNRDTVPERKFWEQYLDGYDTSVKLPVRTSRRENFHEIHSYRAVLSANIKDRLDDISREYRVSKAAVLYSAWGILLRRYGNSEDAIFGTTVSGRSKETEGIENAVGLFINTLPLRVQTSDGERIEFLLERMGRSLQDREAFENTPLIDIHIYSKLNNNEDLFDTIIAIENYPLDSLLKEGIGALTVKSYSIVEGTHYSLSVGITLFDHLTVTFAFNKTEFELDTIVNLSAHFSRILDVVTENPEKEIREIDILSPEEKQQLLIDFNRTGTDYPRDKTVHRLFDEQVRRTPHAVALTLSDGSRRSDKSHISYSELYHRSAGLASVLREKGIRPGRMAAILIERSVEMVVGILGILEAGGAYLPIDPGYPEERTRYILADSEAAVLLKSETCKPEIEINSNDRNSTGTHYVLNFEHLNFELVPNFDIRTSDLSSSNLAYIIYTSGSTGKPKGVMVEHASVVNILYALQEKFPIRGTDTYLLKTSYVFDVSVAELFGWFMGGGRLAILETGGEKDPRKIIDAVAEYRVTHINFVPSMFNVFVEELSPRFILKLSSLKYIFLAGEALLPEMVERFDRLGTGIPLENIYGPTEGTVYSAGYSLSDWDCRGPVPIGTALPNIKLHILDKAGRMQPVRVPGELYITGAGLARGYLNNPELTEKSFNKTDWTNRSYRSGDLCRWLPDGSIEFLGRIDFQVKIRGFRIELGEIENRLRKHDRIKEAVVIDRDGTGGEKYLCAYIIPAGEPGAHPPNPDELLSWLSQTLPDYMVPAHFIPIDHIPLNPNGKVDRKALSEPRIDRIEKQYTPPADQTETKLVEMWARLLDLEKDRISVDTDFFQLGGHSLKATILAGRVYKEFDVDVPLTEILKNRTVRGLSRYIANKKKRTHRPIDPVEKREYYPLSSAQRRQYLLHQLDPHRILYNISGMFCIEGPIHEAKLRECFATIIRRHEILRTSFKTVDGEPVQVVHPEVDFAFEYRRVGNPDPAELMTSFVRPFDLSRAPLLRAALIRTGKEKSLLQIDMHHIVSDGSSVGVFIKEFMLLYAGDPLPSLPIQYKDFSRWESMRKAEDLSLKRQEDYWLKEFQGEIPVLELPVDFPASAVPSFEGRSLTFPIQKEETEKVKILASAEDTTLYTLLLTLFNVFLSKLSGQDDIVVGSPVAGRRHADLEPLIGMFVNTLALRNYPAADKTLKTFLADAKEKTLAAQENQDYPFEFLVEKTAANRGTARNPLFNVMFALQNMEIAELHIPGLKLVPTDVESKVSRFDLTFICEERAGGLHFTVEYSTRMFEARSILRFIEYFKKVVSNGVQSPNTTIARLEIIPEAEKKQVLFDFNKREFDYPTGKMLHQLFDEQAVRTPDAAVLTMSDGSDRTSLTYNRLNRQAGQLAVHLKEKGLQSGRIAGIKMERSIDLIVGILAILKTGAAYLPLDPASPPERTRFMLVDSHAVLMLKSEIRNPKSETNSDDRNKNGMPPVLNFENSDFEKGCPCQGPVSNFDIRISDSSSLNLAYVIYTSGSTGNPKGVPIAHANLSPLLHWGYKTLGIGPGHIAVQNLSYYFDWSVWEIFITLTTGACLDIVSNEVQLNPSAYIAHMNKSRISVLHVTPTQWQYLVDSEESAGYLKYLFIGAERLTYDLVERSIAAVPADCRVFNMYGPTECTIISAVLEIDREDYHRFKTLSGIPIGRAAANFDLFVLDKYLNPCPIKVPGELYIAGDGLGRGYLNDSQKTNRSYQLYRSHRTYRTGDLCRWLDDGNIEFLGRIDFQVKIRGFRIEPGEIENRLLAHPSVKAAVVLDRVTPGGEKYLCAYIVPVDAAEDSTFTPADLKSYLSRSLPDYMVPPYFIRVENIPLNPNGKVDRRALPLPAIKDMAHSYIPPADEIEETLVRIWERVLGVEKNLISTDSEFFQLGGHSLKATILTTEILKELNVNVPLVEIFTRQTVRELSDYIRHEKKTIYTSIEAVEKREYYPLSSAQKRLYFLQQLDLNSTGYNIPAVLPLGKDIDRHKLEAILKILITRHEGLRTSFIRVDSVPFQRVHDPRDIDFSLDYFEADHAAAGEIAKDYIKPFDLSRAPLVRSCLIRHPDGSTTWITDIHHIVSDGTSHTVLVEDFMSLYQGVELDPPFLRIQYKDFSQWQNRLFHAREIKQQEDYWMGQFPDAAEIPRLQLPADFKRPGVFTFEGDNYRFELEEEIAHRFKALGAVYGSTLFMNILAALNTLFYKYSGQTDIIIGTGIAGRRHAEVQRIIGMFVNTLAMRNRPAGEKTYQSFLDEVTANCVKAFENQDLQFEEFVDKLELERNPSRNPLFDVLTVVQNFGKTAENPAPSLITGPSTAAPSAYRNITSKFDLTFFVHEEGDRVFIDIEYYTGIFEPDTIRRMTSHFDNVVRAVVENPSAALKDIDILSPAERQRLLVEFNATATAYPKDKIIQRLFEEQVIKTPGAVALVFGDQSLTYRQLDEKADQLANYLTGEMHIPMEPDRRVGMLMDRSVHQIVTILGILKAGGSYIPFDPSFPGERIKDMIDDACIGVVISQKRYIKTLNKLQWECPSFHTFLCLDSTGILDEEEVEKSELMGKKLWEYVGETATDEITGGGWLSSYTGEPIPKEEMDEYGDNILKKLTPLLSPGMRILEIGCASGISMYRIAPGVGFYYGTDLSGVIIEKNKARVKEEGHANIALSCLPAHEIDRIEESGFDLVIINSVIQCFHGHNYLRNVLRKAVDRLGEKGYLFIGDVMDQDLKKALIDDLTAFKSAHRDKHYKTKTDWSIEIFVSRAFFEDLTVEIPEIQRAEFSGKIYTIENELTRFRYDALLHVDKSAGDTSKSRIKHKYQHDLRDLEKYPSVKQPRPDTRADNLAYIIYTSGSTGKAKGTLISHSNVTRVVKETNYIDFTPRDRVLQLSNYAFDGSVFDIYGALLNGSRLVMVEQENLLALDRLSDLIRREDVTVFFITTALFNALVDINIHCFKGVRKVLFGGEKVSPDHAGRALAYMGKDRVIHVYGPTETTVYATYYFINRLHRCSETVPIGTPIANTTVHILDKDTKLVPIGAAGEIYIGGDGLSRGYLNRVDLTVEKFVMHPSIPGERLYKTGDLARRLTDGNIEFIGRVDHQVKLRGFRIELGEIEDRLLKHDEIKEAVVIVKEGGGSDQRHLIAYIVPRKTLEIAELREHLSITLPDFMIPTYIVPLERFPLSPNGKIDRKALPSPETSAAAEDYIAPRDDVERKLAEIWSGILGIEKSAVSIDADFFQLGGHSLKATILASKLHKELDVKVPLAEIFRTPTIEALARYIRNTAGERFVSVAPVETKEYYPLSAAQKRLYILQQLDPDSTAYNMSTFFTLEGILDKERLEKTFRQLIDRHESLRTSFDTVAGLPVQKIHTVVAFAVEEHPPSFVSRFISPFRLTAAPLLRVGLMKEEEHKHILAVDMHHIISDGTSLGVLSGEFMQLYAGGGLSPLRVRYRDYSHWQNRLVQSGEIARQEAYWLEQFTGEIPLLNLPADHPRPALQRFEGRKIKSALGEREATALRTLALEQGVTLYMLLLSVYNVLLARLGGQEDIVVGTPVAGRRHADLQDIIGMFVNTLVLRNFPAGSKTFPEFLHDVKQRTLAAFENQDYQFEDLVEKMAVTRDASRNPLFDVVFALQNMKAAGIEIPGLRLTPCDLETQTAIFDLSLHVYETGPVLELVIEYSTVLFEEGTVRRFVRFFEELVHSLLESPTTMLSEINILPEDEKHRLLYDFNGTASEYPADKTIHRLFEEQVVQTPDAVALYMSHTTYPSHMTYDRLNLQAGRMTDILKEKGIAPGAMVGIMAERSEEMIIGLLGILKAGCAYVPLNPDAPPARAQYILNECGANIVLTTRGLSEKITPGKEIVYLDNRKVRPANPASALMSAGTRGPGPDLAYVIFTSGSTGMPKGVLITHANLSPLLHWGYRNLGIGAADRTIQNLSYYFDWSVWEIFITLTSGASLHIVREETLLNSTAALDYMLEKKITVLHITPTQYTYLAGTDRKAETLKYLFIGAEKLTYELAKRGLEQVSKECRVFNMYGPTETTIIASVLEIDTITVKNFKELSSIPIGRAIANCRFLVLDSYLNLCPVNITGELYISGDGVARGYLNNPELTAERFSTSDKSYLSSITCTLYKTGDLCRWLPGGPAARGAYTIEYLGRIDHQVKIRGFRIELGEIEDCLSGHDAVETAVVMAREDKEGDKYLCAYFVSRSAPTAAQLRDHLSEQLPDYMIPHFFVQLEQLPVTSSGKINRKALPAPNNTPLAEYIAPRDSIEDTLVCIWSEILDVEKNLISTRDNFFQLGGHSLKATVLISRIHKEFSVNIPLAEIFKIPTIENLAKLIRGTAPDPYASIEPAEKRDYYPLSSAQKRLYILQQMDAGNTAYNISAVFVLEGKLDRPRLGEAFRQLITWHESFRTSFEWGKEGPIQRVHRHVEFEIQLYESIDALLQGIRPFDLSKAPLLRVGLTIVEEEKHVLLVDMHHIISDGTSMAVLTGDFMRSYAGEALPPAGIQYKDFSLRQEVFFRSGEVKKQEAFWLEAFNGEIPVLNLPADHPRPAVQSFEGKSLVFEIGEDHARALRLSASEQGATLYMILLAACNVLLARLTGQDDIIVGTPIAGRRHADLQNIIGMFVNTLAIRNFPKGEKSFVQFLEEVKESTLAAFENQDYQFEELVEKIGVGRDAARNPLFDVMFVLQNIDFTEIEISGLKLKPYERETGTSNFDLTLQGYESDRAIQFSITYSSRLFKEETVRRFISYFTNIVRCIAEFPGIRISEIDMIPDGEKRLLLDEFNRTVVEYPRDKTIHDLFVSQAEQTPDAAALHMSHPSYTSHLTYRELDLESHRLAVCLTEKGVKTGAVAGIVMERSIELIISMLAVLKAGAAYLPVDPGYPEERIRYILADSNAALMLKSEIRNPKSPVQTNSNDRNRNGMPPVLNFEKGCPRRGLVSNFDIRTSDLTSSSFAYVIYTSGTTGRPKGVPVRHRGFVNLIYCQREVFQEEPGSSMSQVANPAFDAMAGEVWPCLSVGAALHIAPEEARFDPVKMKQWLIGRGIAISFQPTLIAEQLLDLEWPEERVSLRALLSAGDRLTRYPSRSYPFTLYNLYGPTEDTVWTTWAEVPPRSGAESPPTIGKPVGSHRVYIVGSNLELQPIGVPGELCIAGVGLAAGYLNNPELTADKFHRSDRIYSIYGTHTLYKTGDLARWAPDGPAARGAYNIEFMGRIDNQVKVRGFRIETGEIENRLTTHRDIREAVVILNGDGQLYAYFVSRRLLSTPELREYLSLNLPAYMIPSHFMQMEKIPLTPNGKVDRKSLPVPGLVRPDLARAYVAPGTDLEKTIADIWKEVLRLAEIGIDDNFFDIGGNSLALIQVNKKLNQVLETQVPVIEMFRYTTIRSLSSYLEQPGMDTGLDRKKRADVMERGKSDRQQRLQKRKQITRKTQ